jgi:hypothetical protein
MGILRSYLGNQLSDNPRDTGDFFSNYLSQQLNQPTANVTPQSTTINYNNDGSVDVTHKQNVMHEPMEQVQPVPVAPPPMPQMPQAGPGVQTASINQQLPQLPPPGAVQNATQVNNAPPAPQQPPPQPVAPQYTQNPTFNRMVQTESGGQQFNPQGGILTSPKGAQGVAQIMPTTASQPGYGIKPATPQELQTAQGNLGFGQRYFEGMFNKFGQDPEKAAAAYNAGPGAIEKALQQASVTGGNWKDYIPEETKKYLTDVFPKHQETANKKLEQHLTSLAQVRNETGIDPREQAIHVAVLNSGDLNALGQGTYASSDLIDPATKKAYADQHATLLEKTKMEKEAPKKVQELITNGGVGLQRALKDESEEGSYVKAYLFQRLGLTALAKNEQQKLGAGDMWTQTMVDGKSAWVKFNGQGAPVKGYSADGELTPKELVQAMSLKGVTTHTGKVQDTITGKIYYEQTTPQGIRLVDNQGQVYSGDSKNLRAYGIGSDVETKNIIQLQTLRNDLLNKPLQKQAEFLAEFNAKNGTNYKLPDVINSQPAMTAGPNQAPVTGAQPPQPVAPQPQQRPPAPGPSGAVEQNNMNQAATNAPQPVAPTQQTTAAAPAVQMNALAPGAQTADFVPVSQQFRQGPSPTPGIPGTKAPPMPQPGEPPAAFEARKKLYDEEMAKVAKEVGELKTKLPDYQAQIDKSLRTITDVVKHPGFETNVGVPGITGILQLPGTDARNWRAKYNQLTGETFLSAFNSLKGGGAISDREGEAATQAQAALKDPGISEVEFRRNAQILEDTLKRGANRARIKVGEQPDPKYMLGTQAPEEKQKAYNWARSNPRDPRSADILRQLGLD